MMKSGLISYCIRLVGKMTQVLKPQHSSVKQIQSTPRLLQPKVSSCRLLRFKWPPLFLPCTFMFSALSIRWKQKNLIKTELSVVCTTCKISPSLNYHPFLPQQCLENDYQFLIYQTYKKSTAVIHIGLYFEFICRSSSIYFLCTDFVKTQIAWFFKFLIPSIL